MVTQPQRSREEGFTLVELLVVIIIIGILAGIAIPLLLGQRTKAADAALVSDLHSVATETEAYMTDHGAYPAPADVDGGTVASPVAAVTLGDGESVRVTSGNAFSYQLNEAGDAYCLVADNSTAAHPRVYISSRSGVQSPDVTACPSSF